MINCEFEDGGKAKLRHMCVDMLIINKQGQILMVKRAPKLMDGGRWGLVGGYMDRDETLKEGAAREALEETGWTIKNLQLLTINDTPERPRDANRQNISAVYICEADKKVGEPDWESTEQKWFDLDQLPPDDQIAFDFVSDIDLYKDYLQGKITIPYGI